MPDDFDKLPKPTLLVVDDAPDNLMILSELLSKQYKIKVATNGEKALRIALSEPPDLIILDIMMPGMDGFEVCRRLKAEAATRNVPVIFLTAKTEAVDEEHGLDIGAVDYIAKPISPAVVMARVRTHLALKYSTDFLRDKNEYLESEVARRTQQVQAIQEVTIQALASLAETRSSETGYHIRRTQYYVKILAEKLKDDPKHAPRLTPKDIELMFKSAPLHDIGKVGIPDRILLKPGKLTPEEYEIMKTHAALGSAAIEGAEKRLGISVPFLQVAKEIARGHHERWDGAGYPDRLAGQDIKLSARLMALADVYDALVNKRIYKAAMSHEEAFRIILEGKGTHFDPEVVTAFVASAEEFQSVGEIYQDEH